MMFDKTWILHFLHRSYKLQRCDRENERHFLMPGDLIEYVRGPFSHWAVYLGSNQIAHLPGPSNLFANFQVAYFSFFSMYMYTKNRSFKVSGAYSLAIGLNQ